MLRVPRVDSTHKGGIDGPADQDHNRNLRAPFASLSPLLIIVSQTLKKGNLSGSWV